VRVNFNIEMAGGVGRLRRRRRRRRRRRSFLSVNV
jgi:hypothetical protein